MTDGFGPRAGNQGNHNSTQSRRDDREYPSTSLLSEGLRLRIDFSLVQAAVYINWPEMDLDEQYRPAHAARAKSQSLSLHLATKPFFGILLLVGLRQTGYASPPPEMAEPLRILRAVGAEGQGNGEASVAWRKLTTSETSRLMPILEA